MINKTAARTIDILELLSVSDAPLTLTEICKHLSIPKSSTFDIINTLIEKEIVEIDNEGLKNYKLGIKAFRIGSSVVTKTDLHRVARPVIDKLSQATSETVYLAVEDKGRIVYLDKVECDSPLRSTCTIGATNPMYLTGLGKALLAAYSDERIEEIVGNNFEVRTPYTIKNFEELMKDIELTRTRGYAVDNRESDEFLRCVAAPVLNRDGLPIAAISSAVLFSKLPDDRIPDVASKVIKAALEISRRLGYLGEKLYD